MARKDLLTKQMDEIGSQTSASLASLASLARHPSNGLMYIIELDDDSKVFSAPPYAATLPSNG